MAVKAVQDGTDGASVGLLKRLSVVLRRPVCEKRFCFLYDVYSQSKGGGVLDGVYSSVQEGARGVVFLLNPLRNVCLILDKAGGSVGISVAMRAEKNVIVRREIFYEGIFIGGEN